MKTYKIPVTWEVCGFVDIKADSVEEAINTVNENPDDFPLPDGDYVDGSFAISTSDPEIVKLYNKEN